MKKDGSIVAERRPKAKGLSKSVSDRPQDSFELSLLDTGDGWDYVWRDRVTGDVVVRDWVRGTRDDAERAAASAIEIVCCRTDVM